MAKDIEKLRQKLIKETKEKVRKAYTAEDNHVIKAVALLEDLDEVFNLMSEHAIDWYSMHFPELGRVVKDNEAYLKFIKLGERQKFKKQDILKFYADEAQAEKVLAAAKESMGSDVSAESLKQMQLLADNALKLKAQRQELNDFIEKLMKKIAPNFSELCGATLAAKLLAQAGSLEKLASLPSSTIQLLGAEKALFRHIRSGVKPPKYGYLFQHPMVKGLRAASKGKMARTLAGKLSLAAREDFYGKSRITAELKKGLEARFEKLKGQ